MPPEELARAVAKARNEGGEPDAPELIALGDSDDPTVLTSGGGPGIAARQFPPLPVAQEDEPAQRSQTLKWVLIGASVCLAIGIAVFVVTRAGSTKVQPGAQIAPLTPARGDGVVAARGPVAPAPKGDTSVEKSAVTSRQSPAVGSAPPELLKALPEAVEAPPPVATAAPSRKPPVGAHWSLPGHYRVGDAEPLNSTQDASFKIINLALRTCGGPIVLEGHSCSIGTEAVRHQIGLDRAGAMRARLVRANIPSDSMQIASMGSSKPIAHNDTNAGRAKNRRVTVRCAVP